MARMSALAGEAAQALLDDAEERLGRDGSVSIYTLAESGQPEDVVMQAAADADLLVSRATAATRRRTRSGTPRASSSTTRRAPSCSCGPAARRTTAHRPSRSPSRKPKPKPKPEPL